MIKVARTLIGASIISTSLLFGANCADPQTNFEMKECESIRLQKADKELNLAYKKLYAKLDNIGREKLKKAQKAWLSFRDANSDFSANSVRGGTMELLFFTTTMASMAEARTRELNEELSKL